MLTSSDDASVQLWKASVDHRGVLTRGKEFDGSLPIYLLNYLLAYLVLFHYWFA